MEVTVAKSAGFCFGVRRAVGLAYEAADKAGGHVYTMGPIIHNEYVVADLESKGVYAVDDHLYCEALGAAPEKGASIIIRSHGVSREVYERIQLFGYDIIDATCPFVQKIHNIVKEKSDEGTPVVIVGDPDHPEVKGIRGWVSGQCAVIRDLEDAAGLDLPRNQEICVVAQTTYNYRKFKEIVEFIAQLGYHVNVTNTICNATKERQEEAMSLAGRSDVMIVIGGKSSSNTQKLYDICRERCSATFFVQSPDDLNNIRIESDSCVGITAGASTPNNIIQEVSLNVRRTEF